MKKAFLVKFIIKEGHEETFSSYSLANLNATRRENGNFRFELYKQGESFLMLEVYENEAAVQEHFATKHFQEWKEKTTDLIESSEFNQLDFVG
ncbi:MAG: putative quinol monooxygenase [Bacteroidota bacterium]